MTLIFPSDVTPTSHICTECKNPLPVSVWKNKRVTCGAKCRKRRERRQKEAHAAYIMALHELQKIRDSINRGEQVKDFRDQLIRLKDEINDLLLLANDKDAQQKRHMLEWLRRG